MSIVKPRRHLNNLALAILYLTAIASIPAVYLDTDEMPIKYARTQYRGKYYSVAWCLPGKGVSRKIILLPATLPAHKWLDETPKGRIRAAINGPLFNSDSGVPFNEVGLGDAKWTANPKWSPCPVQRYCFGMNAEVSSRSSHGIAKMASIPLSLPAAKPYYHVPLAFQQQFPYGFCNIGMLIDCTGNTPQALPAEQSNWARMFPESELARSSLVWTDKGDFILVEADHSTWQETADFVATQLIKLAPHQGDREITGAIMLDGGSTAQFGWAWRKPTGELDMKMPVEQANERQIVPLIIGVEASYP